MPGISLVEWIREVLSAAEMSSGPATVTQEVLSAWAKMAEELEQFQMATENESVSMEDHETLKIQAAKIEGERDVLIEVVRMLRDMPSAFDIPVVTASSN